MRDISLNRLTWLKELEEYHLLKNSSETELEKYWDSNTCESTICFRGQKGELKPNRNQSFSKSLVQAFTYAIRNKRVKHPTLFICKSVGFDLTKWEENKPWKEDLEIVICHERLKHMNWVKHSVVTPKFPKDNSIHLYIESEVNISEVIEQIRIIHYSLVRKNWMNTLYIYDYLQGLNN